MRPFLCRLICAALLLAPSAPALGQESGSPAVYREIEVPRGGRIRGWVKGPPLDEPLKDLHVMKDVATCGEKIANETYLRNEEGFVRFAVVSITDISRGKPVDRSLRPRLDNKDCRFQPHVLAVATGQKIEIVNDDPILHNTHAKMDGKRTVFNVALPIQNHKIPKTIRAPGSMSLRCDAGHLWMSGYIVAFEHPYFSVTGEDGSFEIDRIPPGTYHLHAWHERLGEEEITVEVKEGETVEAVFENLAGGHP